MITSLKPDPLPSELDFFVSQCMNATLTKSLEHFISLAGLNTRLLFSSEHLINFVLPGLTARKVSSKTNDLTIAICDEASTGCKLPKGPWISGTQYQRFLHFFKTNGNLVVFDASAKALFIMNEARHEAIFWMSNVQNLDGHLRAAPLRPILYWALREREFQFIHSAAVGNENGAVLLTGTSGAGKSTTSLLCLQDGMEYLGDDFVVVDTCPPYRVSGIFQSGKLDKKHREAFSLLSSREALYDDRSFTDKEVLFFSRMETSQTYEGLPLRAVVCTHIGNCQNSTLHPCSSGEVLRAMAPTTLSLLPGSGQQDLSRMAQIIRQVPTYSLKLGRDTYEIVSLVRSLIEDDQQ